MASISVCYIPDIAGPDRFVTSTSVVEGQFMKRRNLPVITALRRMMNIKVASHAIILLIAILALPCLSQTASAQTLDTATMRGQVLDQNGAAIANASATVVNKLTAAGGRGPPVGEGFFSIPGLLLPGR